MQHLSKGHARSLFDRYTQHLMRVDVAIIGGTGVGEKLALLPGKPLYVPTSDGLLRGRLVDAEGLALLAISRHSAGHKVPPHLVSYGAVARGLKQLGAKACLSTAAVGSLRPGWGPGTMAVCSDFLDPSARNLTLFDRQVTHRDFSNPFDPDARTAVLSAATNLKVTVHDHAIYVNANGPRYETPFEIEVYKTLGADIVGMTAGSEATVLREAEVPYACLAIVTNLAAGISESPLSHEEVVEVMQSTSSKALDILIAAARILVNQRSHHI